MTGWSLNKILRNIFLRLKNVYTLSDSVNHPMKGKRSQNRKRMWLEPVLVIKFVI